MTLELHRRPIRASATGSFSASSFPYHRRRIRNQDRESMPWVAFRVAGVWKKVSSWNRLHSVCKKHNFKNPNAQARYAFLLLVLGLAVSAGAPASSPLAGSFSAASAAAALAFFSASSAFSALVTRRGGGTS